MSYDQLRHFADSWGLVFMGVVYLILVSWLFLPRGRHRSTQAALAIFEKDDTGADHG